VESRIAAATSNTVRILVLDVKTSFEGLSETLVGGNQKGRGKHIEFFPSPLLVGLSARLQAAVSCWENSSGNGW
jgi:hypothetical protein